MKIYNYKKEITNDLIDFINEYLEYHKITSIKDEDYEDIKEELIVEAMDSDTVTGNGSGSYTCNSLKAQECLMGNWDLWEEALEEFGYEQTNLLYKGPEWNDVLIRCYLVPQCIDEALEKVIEEL